MSKDVIQVHGEDVVVREDTAKAVRGVNWALVSIGAFILIAAALAFFFFLEPSARKSVSPDNPAQNSRSR
jgi:hypothetical protein